MNKKTILLVEDNQDDIELTIRAFKKNNILNNIDVVKDGEEALDYLFQKGRYSNLTVEDYPELVLLDLKLPKLGGLEVLKKIRENKKTSLTPVVILTSSKEEQDLSNGYKLGANSYVRKPVDFNQFMEAVKQLGLYWLVLNEGPPRGK
ncbi:MAG: response regulator [Candidatus Methanofastidiosum sp.]|nr:response regulator [Methanofastidiosum sp.]